MPTAESAPPHSKPLTRSRGRGWGLGRQGEEIVPTPQVGRNERLPKFTKQELQAQLKTLKADVKPLVAALKAADKVARAAAKDVAKAQAAIDKAQALLDKAA